MSKIGHNSGGVDAGRLKSLVQRIEKLREDRAGILADEREVFTEAKSAGYDTKIMRLVLKERAMDKADREERDALRDVYLNAVGE